MVMEGCKTKRGYRLELQVKEAVEELLESGKLGLKPECCKVFLNKKYFSKDRNKKIVTDVSIELIPPGTSQPSLVWIWECKDYSGAVRVNDIEEFHAKLEQIGSDKTKGTMITTGYYQESTIQYALSKGIGLTRLIEGRKVHVEYVPGQYYPTPDNDLCRWVLAYVDEHLIRWNCYTHPLPLSSDQYFFSLTSKNNGAYGASLVTLLIIGLYELRENLSWLASRETFLNLVLSTRYLWLKATDKH